jgi:hypothetical protein
MKQFRAAPDVFGDLLEAIDPELSKATTDAELKKRGSGIHFLLQELDRRARLKAAKATVDKSTVPSGEAIAARNSDRKGSPASADFQSLNSLKSEPKHEPKQ